MSSTRLLAGFFIVAALLIAGCGAKPNTPLSTYERQSTTVPALSTVSTAGRYALFPGNGITPIATAALKPGDKFGFASREGTVVGAYTIGGATKTIPLDGVLASEYVWKLQTEK